MERKSLVGDCIRDHTLHGGLIRFFEGPDDKLDAITGVEVAGDVAADSNRPGVGVDVSAGHDVLVGLVERAFESGCLEVWEEGVCCVALWHVD